MSRKEKSIELLNKAVADELLAVHQYMYFHFRCDDMGYDLLSGLFKRTAIQEMMHVEQLSERILFLKGEVEMKTSGDVQKIHEPKEMLELATAMEEGSVNDYNAWAQECAANADAVKAGFLCPGGECVWTGTAEPLCDHDRDECGGSDHSRGMCADHGMGTGKKKSDFHVLCGYQKYADPRRRPGG